MNRTQEVLGRPRPMCLTGPRCFRQVFLIFGLRLDRRHMGVRLDRRHMASRPAGRQCSIHAIKQNSDDIFHGHPHQVWSCEEGQRPSVHSLVAPVGKQVQGVAAVSKSVSWEVAVPMIKSTALHHHTLCTST